VLVRTGQNWKLFEGAGEPAATEVTIGAEQAWKIFTRGMRGAEAMKYAEIRGVRELGERVLGMVSVIA
jgi:hypothetical protein